MSILSYSAQAEVYSWKDENGKTHFGDHIPEQYSEVAETIEINIDNGYTHTDTNFRPDPTRKKKTRKISTTKKQKQSDMPTPSLWVSESDLESIKKYCDKKFPDDPGCVSAQANSLIRNTLRNKNRPFRFKR